MSPFEMGKLPEPRQRPNIFPDQVGEIFDGVPSGERSKADPLYTTAECLAQLDRQPGTQ